MPDISPSIRPVSDFVSQIFVLHRTGMVSVSRVYAKQCNGGDSQLVGGFIAAILAFTTHSNSVDGNKCSEDPKGDHQLIGIATTCSKWYLSSNEEYVSALLIPNTSPLMNDKDDKVIRSLGSNILDSYRLFKDFNISVEEILREDVDKVDGEMRNTIDNLVADVLKKLKGFDVSFAEPGTLENYDVQV